MHFSASFSPPTGSACATWQYFYPGCGCQRTTAAANAQQRPAAIKPAAAKLRPALVRTYPNPAQERVTLDLAGLPAVRLQLVAAATGQVALTQALTGEAPPVVAVAKLAPGVYQGQLLSATGQTVGTCKIVVIR